MGLLSCPYVWAPIKLMLQLASSHQDIFDALLNAYADIGAALPRFDRYEKAFRENREFQNVLATVYCSILEFHERTYKFLQRRAWSIIFLSLWKDFQSRFNGIIESLKKQRDFVDAEAASIDIVESAESRARLQSDIEQRQKVSTEALERNEKSERMARLRSSVEWLAVDDIAQETEFERMSRRRHRGTCEWIDGLSEMKNWVKNDTKHSLLWLSGKPGAGKSVMCSHIIRVLDQVPKLSILKTVALQLLRRHLDLASLIANEYVGRLLNCSIKQLRVLIPQILELVSYTRIVVDGLDECSIADQKEVLKELRYLCLRPEIRCKILFASRREVRIREKLSSSPHISLESREEVESDIRLYVKYKVMKLRASNVDLLNEIESLLVEKANGMFLWVHLVVEELRQCYNDADMKERALSLPKGLEKAQVNTIVSVRSVSLRDHSYSRILDRILDENPSASATSIAIRILEWMSCSYRPLKSYEILDGISLRLPESDGTTHRSACTILDKTTQMQRDVLDLCKPLVEDGPGNTIDFVHFSAKEYILKQEYRNARPFIKTESAHLNISFSCVSYLNMSFSLLRSNCTDQERASMVLQGFHSLQFYANQFWFKHVLACCGLFATRNAVLPDDLLIQFERLLRLRKGIEDKSSTSEHPEASSSHHRHEDPLALEQLPRNIKGFIWEVIEFRKRLKNEDNTLKSTETITQEACSADPTYFSETRYLYQTTLEELLNANAAQHFLWLDPNQLRSFKEKFGASAFMCRYTHCYRATDGFDSSRKRDEHETAHQRKYRCTDPSCASYSTGFANRSGLNRHNDCYHSKLAENVSLSQGIVLALRYVPKSPTASPLQLDTNPAKPSLIVQPPYMSSSTRSPVVAMQPQMPANAVSMASLPRTITQEQIMKVRTHPSGKWAAVSDDKIKQLIVRNSNLQIQRRLLTQQRQVQQAQLRQMEEQTQKAQQAKAVEVKTRTNNQQYTQPSNPYSNPNFSADIPILSSIPASSNANLTSLNTQDAGVKGQPQTQPRKLQRKKATVEQHVKQQQQTYSRVSSISLATGQNATNRDGQNDYLQLDRVCQTFDEGHDFERQQSIFSQNYSPLLDNSTIGSQFVLSGRTRDTMKRQVLGALLGYKDFELFHSFLRSCSYAIDKGTITCFRDLEDALRNEAPFSNDYYFRFGFFSSWMRKIESTISENFFTERELTRPGCHKYTRDYFNDQVVAEFAKEQQNIKDGVIVNSASSSTTLVNDINASAMPTTENGMLRFLCNWLK